MSIWIPRTIYTVLIGLNEYMIAGSRNWGWLVNMFAIIAILYCWYRVETM